MYSKQSQLQSTKKKKPKTVTRKGLVRQLDDLIRKIIRKRDTHCCSCNKPLDDTLQVSHFVTRRVYALRWDLRNVAGSCPGCNLMHNWNPAPYASFIVTTWGKDVLQELAFSKNRIQKVTTPMMRDLVVELQEKLEEITS